MSTTTQHTVTTEYASLGLTVAKNIHICNVGSEEIELFFGASASASDTGIYLAPKDSLNFELETGENCFARVYDKAGVGSVVTITPA